MKSKMLRIAKGVGLLFLVSLTGLSIYLYLSFVGSQKRVRDVAARMQDLSQTKRETPQTSITADAQSEAGRMLPGQPGQAPFASPENTPLVSIWKSLREKADAGDAYSSCRLAMELQRCAIHEKVGAPNLERLNEIRARASSSPDASPGDWARIEGLQQKYLINEYVCRGFNNPEDLSSDKYLLQAALLGHVEAKRLIATMPSLTLLTGTGTIESLVARREYSSQFLRDLAQEGSESGLFELARQYAGESWWSSLTLKDAPKTSYSEAAVYAIAADLRQKQHRAANPSLQPFSYTRHLLLDKRLSEAQLQEAQGKAEQLAKGFPPIDDEAASRKVATKQNNPEADSRVLLCRR
jgi:hypothetical protein